MKKLMAWIGAGTLGAALAAGAPAQGLGQEQLGQEEPGREGSEEQAPEAQTPGTPQPGTMPGEEQGAMPGERKGARMGTAERVIQGWPQESQQAARAVIEKYGEPELAGDQMLVWRNNGPWKGTIVHRESVRHNFPLPHNDVLEQSISYSVPVEKVAELAQFDGSLLVDRTKGLLIARHDREAANYIALNLANEIIEGKKSVEEARRFFGKTLQEIDAGRSSKYAEGFLFRLKRWLGSGDPGKSVEGELTEEAPKGAPTEEKQP